LWIAGAVCALSGLATPTRRSRQVERMKTRCGRLIRWRAQR
jgi:hypothetical protein